MAKAIVLVLTALAFSRLVFGSTLEGTVIDPQQRVIPGAQVRLQCGTRADQTVTGPQGQFAFAPRPSFAHCSLAVSHPGFATFEKVLGMDSPPALIELHLATNKEGITVHANPQDLRQLLQSSLGSASLSGDELERISNNPVDVIRYAKALAGADSPQDAIYVDGLPSATLPPVAMIGRIEVNNDPFSAEYSDDDRTHINITTKGADRHLRFNFGGAGLGTGGNNPLGANLPSISHSASFNLTGPAPFAPLTFSLHANLGSARDDQPIEASLPPNLSPSLTTDSATLASHNGAGGLALHYSLAESSQVDLFYSTNYATGTNVGVGGLTLPEAGASSQSHSQETRLTFARAGASYLYRGGLVLNDRLSSEEANRTSLGLVVPGSFVAGGAALSHTQSRHTDWTWKNVVQSGSNRRFWTAGLTLARSGFYTDEQPNAYGQFEFSTLEDYAQATAGQPTGTWFVTVGNGQAHYASIEAAPFIQGDLFHSQKLLIIGGLRSDYQTGGGVILSPRLSGAATLRRFVFRAGTGMFVHEWPESAMLRIVEEDGQHLQPYMFENAPLADASLPPGPAQLLAGPLVLSKLASDLTRPRDWMVKGSVERPIGHLTPGLEYTWTDGQHLLGSERLAAPGGWLDILESNRARERDQVHFRLRYTLRRQSITAHYEWIHSRDDTNGPFSFPENQNGLSAEWARSAGVSPQNLSLVDSLRLPRAFYATLIATARGSSPYNITSGLDNGDGLFNDRGGRPRNSGDGPGYRSVDLFGSRRIQLPGIAPRSGGRIYINVGLQAQNLLGGKNYTALDSVASSALFGKPLGAGPGRSVRLWINLE